MENKELIFKDWSFDGIESESENSLVCRARREQFGETLHAIVKQTHIPCPDPTRRAELRSAADARMRNLSALGNISTLLVPDEYIITDDSDGFTIHSRMEQCTRLAIYAASHPLSQQELVMMGIDLCTALDALEKRSLRLTPILEIGRTDIIVATLAKGIGISFLPELVTRQAVQEGQLCYLDVTDPEIDIWKQLIYHRSKWISRSLRAFIDYVKQAEFSNEEAQHG